MRVIVSHRHQINQEEAQPQLEQKEWVLTPKVVKKLEDRSFMRAR